jgi:hypothetical protein
VEQEAISIEWHPSGRGKARCKPNPDFPDGIDMDVSEGQTACAVDLPYPAPECGAWIVRCMACGMSVAVTAAGRPDDPRTLKMACKENREQAA